LKKLVVRKIKVTMGKMAFDTGIREGGDAGGRMKTFLNRRIRMFIGKVKSRR